MALDAASNTSIGDLPPEILVHICSVLQDDDLASAHLVDTRLCVAAQAALYAAFPQSFGFIRLALQHRYPLRQLSTPALPFCNLLASYLAEAPSTLTCLNVAHRWCYNYKALCNMPPADARYAPLVDVLQGISSLRRLSCQVNEDVRGFLQPSLAGLSMLSLAFEHLWQMEYVEQFTDFSWCVGTNDTEWPSPGNDEDIAAIVQALPQLHQLQFACFAASSTDAGLCQLSRLRKLQGLSLANSCTRSTHSGLSAALATMAGLETLSLSCTSRCGFMTQQAVPGIAQRTSLTALYISGLDHKAYGSATDAMLKALGPRLQHLAIRYDYNLDYNELTCHPCNPQDNLVHAILRHCPQLKSLRLSEYLPPDNNPQEVIHASLPCCTQLCLSYPSNAEASVLGCVQGLLRLQLVIGDDWLTEEICLASIIKGLQSLVHLQCVSIEICPDYEMMDSLLGMLEAMASCSRLSWLQLSGNYFAKSKDISPAGDGLCADHLRALAAQPQLTALNTYHLCWDDDAVALGPAWLAARLPRLRVLNVWTHVLAPAVLGDTSLLDDDDMYGSLDDSSPVASYELRDLPGRRLRRWSRRTTLGDEPARVPWDMPE